IDWEKIVILPRYVAFKGNNNRFLRLTEVGGQPSLEFSSEDVVDHSVTMKVFYRKNGDIRIKPVSSDRFWRTNDKDTHFRAFKVDSKTIALLNVGNDKFCKRYITRVTTDILAATDLSITKEAYLRVLEPNSATNRTTQANTLDVKLSYSETNTSTWLARFTLDLETKATFQVGVPFIGETGVEISSKYETGIEWGKTKTMTTDMEVTHQVRVPPMTKVTVYLKMTNGTCDVPFVFTQKDTLYNGTFVTTDVLGNTFTGTNYYNIQYDSKEEPLTS
ncbi:hypothetical protein Golob_025510, partial [Gossypium lobatum]|nr:hypothetical protein [Gossypium lobatum]